MSIDSRIHVVADEALGNSAYLIEVGSGQAVVVDPRRDVDAYLELAQRLSLEIVAILETHLHADFISGARELIAASGAQLYAAKDAGVSFEHHPVSASDRFEFGDTVVEIVATPGHTPEHVAFLMTTPHGTAVFSGGSLINGGAARTDLTGEEHTEQLARAQFSSVRLIAGLPEETLLCPTHGGGSFCSATSAPSQLRTIAEEGKANPLLRFQDEEQFVRAFVAGFGTYPPYFRHLRAINKRGAFLLSDLLRPQHLSHQDARAALARGSWLIDTRSVDQWARGHPSGAVSIALRPAFASWLGWVVPFGDPVLLLIDEGQLDDTIRLSRRIGYDRIQGWTTLQDWRAAGVPLESSTMIDPSDASLQELTYLDVRQDSEFAASHLPNACHLELGDIVARKLPESKDVVVYCGHGERSATAVSLLERRGVRAANLSGGIIAWRKAGLPVTP